MTDQSGHEAVFGVDGRGSEEAIGVARDVVEEDKSGRDKEECEDCDEEVEKIPKRGEEVCHACVRSYGMWCRRRELVV